VLAGISVALVIREPLYGFYCSMPGLDSLWACDRQQTVHAQAESEGLAASPHGQGCRGPLGAAALRAPEPGQGPKPPAPPAGWDARHRIHAVRRAASRRQTGWDPHQAVRQPGARTASRINQLAHRREHNRPERLSSELGVTRERRSVDGHVAVYGDRRGCRRLRGSGGGAAGRERSGRQHCGAQTPSLVDQHDMQLCE